MRRRFWIIISCLVFLPLGSTNGQTNDAPKRIGKLLRGVSPFVSTAGDVKKLLGEPIRQSPAFYESDGFNVMVSYTTGLPCEKEPSGWNVPRDRVNTFAIIVTAAFHQQDLKNIGIDLGTYEKAGGEESVHVPGPIYTNREKGIRLYLNGDQVTSIALFPAKKYLHLMCQQIAPRPN